MLLIIGKSQLSIGPYFGNDDDIIFFRTEGFAETAFRFSIAIPLGSVEGGDSLIQSRLYRGIRLFRGADISPPLARRDLPATEGDDAPVLCQPFTVYGTHLTS